jgi:predicted solute-binding protein
MHAELLAELAHAPGAAPVSAALSAAAPSAARSSVLVQDISIDTLGKIVSIQLLAGPDARTGRAVSRSNRCSAMSKP